MGHWGRGIGVAGAGKRGCGVYNYIVLVRNTIRLKWVKGDQVYGLKPDSSLVTYTKHGSYKYVNMGHISRLY